LDHGRGIRTPHSMPALVSHSIQDGGCKPSTIGFDVYAVVVATPRFQSISGHDARTAADLKNPAALHQSGQVVSVPSIATRIVEKRDAVIDHMMPEHGLQSLAHSGQDGF